MVLFYFRLTYESYDHLFQTNENLTQQAQTCLQSACFNCRAENVAVAVVDKVIEGALKNIIDLRELIWRDFLAPSLAQKLKQESKHWSRRKVGDKDVKLKIDFVIG